MTTLILGGGIIGLSTAYYLSQISSSSKVIIIDSASDLLLSASSYAGGFLARDWFSPESAELGELSFRLHRELADKHDGRRKWGYSSSKAYSLSIDRRGVGTRGKKKSSRDWLTGNDSRSSVAATLGSEANGEGAGRDEMLNDDGTPAWVTRQEGGTLSEIGSDDGCAQVEPRELCLWLLNACKKSNVEVWVDSMAKEVVMDESGRVNGVKVEKAENEKVVKCDNIVVAAGAWTPKAFAQIFPQSKIRIPVSQLAGYSIVVRSPRYSKPIVDPTEHEDSVTGVCHSVFCAPGPGWRFAPEAISRVPPHGKPEVYVGGLNDSAMKLPVTADGVKGLVSNERTKALKDVTVKLTGLSKESDDMTEDDLEVVREGLCFRPISDTGVPVLGKVSSKKLGVEMAAGDVFVASGHGPWGISLSLGTGMVMAEMILGKETSADVSELSL